MWFKVDDLLAFHPKTLAAGNAAMGLWLRAGAWSAGLLTDGYIPNNIIISLGNTSQAHKLCDAGLWVPDHDGYTFHDWSEFQPTRAEIEARRLAGAERVKRYREKPPDLRVIENGHNHEET